jgi:uncharacterized membrane protein
MIPAAFATLIRSANDVLWRDILHNRNLSAEKFITYTFIGQVLVLSPFAPLFFDWQNSYITPMNMIVMLSVIFFAVFANWFHFTGLKNTVIENAEPLALSHGIFAVCLAYIIFPSERDNVVLILALIAAGTLLALNIRRRHLSLDQYSSYIMIAAFLWALNSMSMRYLLFTINPLMLLYIRAVIMSLIMLVIVKVQKVDLGERRGILVGIASITDVACFSLVLLSYSAVGIITTMLFLSLAPILAEWWARLFLKERLHWKNFIGTGIITACIALTYLI